MNSAQDSTTAAAQAPVTSEQAVPRVWLVTGYRAGERTQILALAEALGWPFELKELSYRKTAVRTNLFRGSDLSGIDLAGSDVLAAPWPDLVISAGMRNEPVCRWIREQSGGRTAIVHIGRPWADPERFELVITTPQYRLPQRANVLHNELTLHRVTPARLAAEAERCSERMADLPAPHIAVIVGGDSGPYTFGPRAAKRLAEQASAMARELGGSLLVTTSSRTSPAATRALREHISVPADFYAWRANDADNPYFAYLGVAEHLIVTMDSISMLSEACATGKPVYMFRLERAGLRPDARRDFRVTALLYHWLMRYGWQRLSRDISLVHERLIASGRAVWLGEPRPDGAAETGSDIERAVAAVRRLFADGNN